MALVITSGRKAVSCSASVSQYIGYRSYGLFDVLTTVERVHREANRSMAGRHEDLSLCQRTHQGIGAQAAEPGRHDTGASEWRPRSQDLRTKSV
jgi:hypothetical protein